MRWPDNPLEFDPRQEIQQISSFILDTFHHLGAKAAVIGLSGGLDSALTAALSAEALGPENLRPFYLPERDSNPLHGKHARMVADQLSCELREIAISAPLRTLGIYRLLPLSFFPSQRQKSRAVKYGKEHLFTGKEGEFLASRLDGSGGSWVSRANAYISAKHRLRMAVLYREAEKAGGIVIGAANRTEWQTGTFTLWGCDHCADLMPILHLYRSQLLPLAEYLGLPPEILQKKADPDLLPGLDDKGTLLGSFETADSILWGLENNYPQELLSKKFGEDQVAFIQRLHESSARYREAPYSLLGMRLAALGL